VPPTSAIYTHPLVTGRPIYQAKETGQIRRGAARSELQIHELGDHGMPRCGNRPAPGKKLVKLGRGPVTCGSCAGQTGHEDLEA